MDKLYFSSLRNPFNLLEPGEKQKYQKSSLIVAGTVTLSLAAIYLYISHSSGSSSSTTTTTTSSSSKRDRTKAKLVALQEEIQAEKDIEEMLNRELIKLKEQRTRVRAKELQLHKSRSTLNKEISQHYKNSAAAIEEEMEKQRIEMMARDTRIEKSNNQPTTEKSNALASATTPDKNSTIRRKNNHNRQWSMHMSPSSKEMMQMFRKQAKAKRQHFTAWVQYVDTCRRKRVALEALEDDGELVMVVEEEEVSSSSAMMSDSDWDKFIRKVF
jgi:septal ring factor EnvC (AmiA/AmiB activator)